MRITEWKSQSVTSNDLVLAQRNPSDGVVVAKFATTTIHGVAQ